MERDINKLIKIPGELTSVAGDHIVAATEEIYDYLKSKRLDLINADTQESLNILQTKVDKAYVKPLDGIPTADLTQSIIESLQLANNALLPDDLNTLVSKVSHLENLILGGEDPTAAIDTYNEIVSFLAGITNTLTLFGIIGEINNTLSGKLNTITDLTTIRQGATKGSTSVQPNDIANFITVSVNNLVNYYNKSETYTKDEISNIIGNLKFFKYEIVQTLPSSGEDKILYLLGPTGSGADKYEEYIYANNTFVKIGERSLDLSGYVQTSELTTLLNGKLNTLTFDNSPTAYSNNPVTSNGIFNAINTLTKIEIATYNVTTYNLVAEWQSAANRVILVEKDGSIGHLVLTTVNSFIFVIPNLNFLVIALNSSDVWSATTTDLTPKIFEVTYGTTSQLDIIDAYIAGKEVICHYNNHLFRLFYAAANATYCAFYTFDYTDSFLYIYVHGTTYSTGSIQLENATNKVTSLSNLSTDTLYPSAKCVYDFAQPEIFEVTYGTTSQADIVSAFASGKEIICHYNGHLYRAFYADSQGNHCALFTFDYYTESLLYIMVVGTTYTTGSIQLENVSNKVTSISASSTDTQYPTARAVFNYANLKTTFATLSPTAITHDLVATLQCGYNYFVNGSVDTCEFILPEYPDEREISIIFTTDTDPAITITANNSDHIYVNEGFGFEANSIYEMNIRRCGDAYDYYIVLAKMEELV